MALEVKKREKESVQSLVRRFTRAVQQSGILVRAREKMFKDREKSENLKREAALRREEIKKKYEKLKKLGKI
jgi:ribosomal protein S21